MQIISFCNLKAYSGQFTISKDIDAESPIVYIYIYIYFIIIHSTKKKVNTLYLTLIISYTNSIDGKCHYHMIEKFLLYKYNCK